MKPSHFAILRSGLTPAPYPFGMARFCCQEHGSVTAMEVCKNHGHSYDSLYPKSVYYCPQCQSEHGTSAVNGAVSWHCQRCWTHGLKAVDQVYLGRLCTRCGALDAAGAKFLLTPDGQLVEAAR